MLNRQIIEALERFAPPTLQESWDNTGLQVGTLDTECTGVLICFDVTPQIVAEAIGLNYNLIISHHPLFFKGVKQLIGATDQQISAINAICVGITIYSSHTALDSALGGVSYTLAQNIGLKDLHVLDPRPDNPETGLGIYGRFEKPIEASELFERVKGATGAKMLRTTHPVNGPKTMIECVALCGGAGGEYVARAKALGAQAYITGDVRYHDFVDWQDRILLIDAGHYETEAHIKHVLYDLLRDAYPEFTSIACTKHDDNPINYI